MRPETTRNAPLSIEAILDTIRPMRRIELGYPLDTNTPHLASHPPLMHRLIRQHGDLDMGGGVTAAADMITIGLHAGTHLDALGHIARDGRSHGDIDVMSSQTADGLRRRGVDELPAFVLRGVLIDVARERGAALDIGDAVSVGDVERCIATHGIDVQAEDAALVRTGWPHVRGERSKFAARGGAPGVSAEAAGWLAGRGVSLVGADTPAFEPLPSPGIPAHVELLVERGIPIIEFLDLEALAEERPKAFILVVVPLRIVGGTASPVRPIAFV